jgi:N-acetylmuramoyl-L-alanine amidase
MAAFNKLTVTIKRVDETLSPSRRLTIRLSTAKALRACALWGTIPLAATAMLAQSGAPVVVTSASEGAQATMQPGVMNRMTVVLDASHGGADAGARISEPGGNTILEKDVTLALALRLQSLLMSRGFTVVMTRNNDAADKPGAQGVSEVPMSFDDRAGMANNARASACLLLHAAGSGHGVHLYSTELDGVAAEPPVLPWRTAQAPWVALSGRLSKQIGDTLQQTGVPRIISRASVRPVDSLTCPAVVVELAPEGEDVRSVNDGDYQQRVALAVAGALEIWAKQVQPPPRLPSALGHPKTTTNSTASPHTAGAQP